MSARSRLGTAAATIFVVLFLVIQTVFPVAALFGDRPGRMGWQMYSALPHLPVVWTVSDDGSRTPLELAGLFANLRAEIDYPPVLRTNLCEATGAYAVLLMGVDGQPMETIRCR